MRLFAALMPPEAVLDEIAATFGPHHDAWPGLRWTRRESWHVTLAFYGEVDERTAGRLPERLGRAAARHPARELAFAGAGAFPRPASARVLWTGIETDLRRLAESCVAAGRRAGVDIEDAKRFRPHLTLARARDPLDVRPLVDGLHAYAGTAWTAGEIHLIRSHPGPRPRYETLHTWPLRQG